MMRIPDDDHHEGKGSCSSSCCSSSSSIYAGSGTKRRRKICPSTLHAACRKKTVEDICTLLDLGADPQQRNIFGETALHYVTTAEMVTVILQAGADINARNRQMRTPLHLAIIYDRSDTARKLVSAGADLGARDTRGKSSLDYACQYQNEHLVRYIIGSGGLNVAASVDFVTGLTPLHWAEGKAVVDLLVDAGASVHARDKKGRTPVHFMFSRSNITLCALLNRGADVNSMDNNGNTPLHCLRRDVPNPYLVNFVIGRGANFRSRNVHGKTPLHLAAQRGYGVMARTLIEAGEDPGRKSAKGLTSLVFAAANGHLDVVRMIIGMWRQRRRQSSLPEERDEPDIVNAMDPLQQTALHYAARRGYVAVANALMWEGADPRCRSTKRLSVLDVGVLNGQLQIVNLLIQYGVSVTDADTIGRTPLYHISRLDRTSIVASSITSVLMDAGADPIARDSNGLSCLDLAAGSGQWEVVRTMISKGADVRAEDEMGWTPLHYAAKMGRVNVAKALVNAGADPAKRNVSDASALDIAAGYGKVGVLDVMIESGAQVTDVDNNGFTALHLAESKGVVDSLVRAGADVDAQNNEGNTPLMYQSIDIEVVQALLGHGAQVNIQNEKGETSIHNVLNDAHGKTMVLVLRMLLDAGADETIVDNGGRKPEDYLRATGEGDEMTPYTLEARKVLENAPKNRRWERRRTLIMCMEARSPSSFSSSSTHLATWLLEIKSSADGVFRTIVGYI